MLPLRVGTMAMFEVIAPSNAFSVDGQRARLSVGPQGQIPQPALRDNRCVKHIGLCGCWDAARTPHNIHGETQGSIEG